MKPPVMALPPESVPWGRWVEGEQEGASASLNRQVQDSGNSDRQFKSKADLVQQQIYDLQDNVDVQYSDTIGASFFAALWGSEDTHFYGSVPIDYANFDAFTPPRDDQWYNASVIVVMEPTDNTFAYPKVVLWINGQQFMTQHENFQPQYLTKPCLSIMGTIQLPPGKGVDYAYAIGISNTGMVGFENLRAWCIFSRIDPPT